MKNNKTQDNLHRKTTDSADLPKLKRNNEIKFDDENNITCLEKVINSPEKAADKYDNCSNIKYKSSSERPVTKTGIDMECTLRMSRRGRRILQIFQKKIRCPGDHRPKYFMAPPINFSFLFKSFLKQYFRVVITVIFKFQITKEVNIHNNIQKIIFQ